MMDGEDGPRSAEGALDAWLDAAWARGATEFRVDVDGAGITCRGWNLGATHLPGIVFVHGFRAHARWWDHIAPSFAQGHRVVALDLSGMGDSDRRQTYTRGQHGREALAVGPAAGIERPILIAHSYGAVATMIAARETPDALSRLVIIDSALPLNNEDDHQIPVPPQRVYGSMDAAVERFRLIPPGRWPNPRVLDHVARHGLRRDGDGWTWKFDPQAAASLNRERYRDRLFGQTVPFDIVHGELTELMGAERLALAREMAPHAGAPVSVPLAHHHIPIEQPVALVAALNGILART
jgi:pimeloyl-ACP methyl ester carboxylesterase